MARTKGHFTIFKRDDLACIYCGATAAEGAKLTVDHIIPVKSGGSDRADNLVTCCLSCNSQKQSMELSPASLRRIVEVVQQRNQVSGIADNQVIKIGTISAQARTIPVWKAHQVRAMHLAYEIFIRDHEKNDRMRGLSIADVLVFALLVLPEYIRISGDKDDPAIVDPVLHRMASKMLACAYIDTHRPPTREEYEKFSGWLEQNLAMPDEYILDDWLGTTGLCDLIDMLIVKGYAKPDELAQRGYWSGGKGQDVTPNP